MNLDTVHVARADKVIYRDGDTVIKVFNDTFPRRASCGKP